MDAVRKGKENSVVNPIINIHTNIHTHSQGSRQLGIFWLNAADCFLLFVFWPLLGKKERSKGGKNSIGGLVASELCRLIVSCSFARSLVFRREKGSWFFFLSSLW